MNGKGVRLDHLVSATPDLDATVDQLERALGLRASAGGQHEGQGTRNALIALGPDSYLEILGPDPSQPAPARPRWFGIDTLNAPRLVAWAIHASNLSERIAAANNAGVGLGPVRAGSRLRTDGVRLAWQYSDPRTIVADGIVPFLIDWGDSPHPAQTAAQGLELTELRAEHPDAARVQQLLDKLGVELAVSRGPAPALIATLQSKRGQLELR